MLVSVWLVPGPCPLLFPFHRHIPLHSFIFSWRNVALLLLFFLSLEQTSASPSYRAKKKPGECLQERITCDSKAPDLCKTDFSCDEHLKCCSFACGKKCLDPYEEPCLLPLDKGHCKKTVKQWYFNTEQRVCKPFFYGGCLGNANSFSKKEDCMKACSSVVKDGQCPLFPFKNRMECSASCKSDYDCPLNEKCCESMCGFACAMAWTVKAGFCPNKPPVCATIDRPRCLLDDDCPLTAKCCSRCGLKCTEPLK